MKICIVSDSHDRADALAQAVCDAKAQGAEAVIHCGDLIGAQTVKPALAHGLPMHLIHGNNLGDPQALHFQMQKSGGLLRYHGPDARLELGGDEFSSCIIRSTATRWPAPAIGTSYAAAIRMSRAWTRWRTSGAAGPGW